MRKIAGIRYTKDVFGRKRYVHIDLDTYGDNQLVEDLLDLLDLLDIKASKRSEKISLDELNQYIDKRLEADV
ncbi:MAG: hypothetical protein LBU44_02150 [Mediterranea sp.]|jgi:hypothetical protein|nr:hypothetical protein [Mediterranea sp.]